MSNPLLDEESPTWALEKFREREPLVQEVIAAHKLFQAAATYGAQLKAQELAWEAVCKLAEWKP